MMPQDGQGMVCVVCTWDHKITFLHSNAPPPSFLIPYGQTS